MQFDPDEYEDAASDVIDQVSSDEPVVDEDTSSETEDALTAAMQRIEEANLWKILIKQDVFENGSARPEILLAANRKIKKFALGELNKLLNIGQPEPQAQKVEVKLPFDQEEVLALRVLAAKVLKRDSSSLVSEDVTPKVKSVAAVQQEPMKKVTEPTIKTVGSGNKKSATQQQTQPKQQAQAQPKQRKRGGRVGGGVGYAKPTTRPLPMPSADQLMGMQLPTAQVTAENISQGEMRAADPASLVASVVSQLTGGNLVSQHVTVSEEDDINGRL